MSRGFAFQFGSLSFSVMSGCASSVGEFVDGFREAYQRFAGQRPASTAQMTGLKPKKDKPFKKPKPTNKPRPTNKPKLTNKPKSTNEPKPTDPPVAPVAQGAPPVAPVAQAQVAGRSLQLFVHSTTVEVNLTL